MHDLLSFSTEKLNIWFCKDASAHERLIPTSYSNVLDSTNAHWPQNSDIQVSLTVQSMWKLPKYWYHENRNKKGQLLWTNSEEIPGSIVGTFKNSGRC